jgi:hypothetical protein
MGKRLSVVVLGVVLLAAPVTASAASPWADEVTYGAQAGAKLKYGVKNLLLGWTSLFREPVQAHQAGENVFVGVGRGVWNGVGQTVGGALHTVTFFVPQIDVPLPEGGTDLLS